MAHTYTNLLIHYIFSTKNRQKIIASELRNRLWTYMAGIANNKGLHVLIIGGTPDHTHLLLGLPPTITISKVVQLIKGSSSKWIHENFPELKAFAWQEGFSAFSVSISHAGDTIKYIENQVEHHRTKTFQEEYRAFLKKHKIVFHEKYLWG